MTSKGEIKSVDNRRFHDNSNISIVGGGVNLVVMASAGASLVPGRTFQTMSKSCKKRDQQACWRESLQESLM